MNPAAHTLPGERTRSFAACLTRHVVAAPDEAFLHEPGRSHSRAEVQAEVLRVATLLAARGARRGERIALWLPNGIAWLVLFLACARLGLTVVALNTRFRSHEVGDIIARAGCRWLALQPGFRGIAFADILQDVEPGQLAGLQALIAYHEPGIEPVPPAQIAGRPVLGYDTPAPGPAVAPAGRGDDGAILYTTSGTTAAPKLVLHDQHGLLQHGDAVARALDIRAGDAVLLAAPLCGAFGFSTALGALACGARLVASASLDPAELAALIAAHGVTHGFANNELIARVFDAADAGGHSLASLRHLGFASFAPGLESLFERAAARGIPLGGLYGSSELQALVAAQPLDAPDGERRQAGGRLVAPDARLRVRDPDSGALLPRGEAGEIEILAPSLMRGYLDDPDATARAVDADGWFRTGDLGHALDDRHFVFHARRGDALRLNGFLVHPAEIEQVLAAHAGVAAAQAVGVVHGGHTVVVAFVLAPNGTAAPAEHELLAHCAHRLARFKVPRRVVFLDAFPVVQSANSNKIQRHKLQEMARALLPA
ncbi:AMP-binding protein [Pseudorhodoferax sp.]|uniref:AMP-binding protein n=1 Tax=Pseudorhodoferax sp. TaxID=1993553 RepID=UPI002DD66CE9|nr:AMP-binding protein [Pseudorhodoferax sp.]